MPLLICGFLNPLVLGGTIYSFGFYGNALKQQFHLTQANLDTVSSVFFAAGLLAWIPGMVADRFGVQIGMIVGGIWTTCNIGLYWSLLRQFIVIDNPWFLVACLASMRFLISLSVAMIEAGTYKSVIQYSKPIQRGVSVGLAKGYPGLGTGVFSLMFQTLHSNTNLNFPLMMATFIVIVITIPTSTMVFFRGPCKNDTRVRDETTDLHYHVLVAGYLALAVLLTGVTVVDLMGNPNSTKTALVFILFLLVWIGPIVSIGCLPRSTQEEEEEGETNDEEIPTETEQLQNRNEANNDDENGLVKREVTEIDALLVDAEKRPKLRKERNVSEMLTTAAAWYLVWTFVIVIGQGTTVLNNIGEMVQAQGFASSTITPVALAMMSVSQALSRVIAGAVCGGKQSWSPPLVLTYLCVISAAGHFVLAVSYHSLGWFLFGVSLAAVGFGAAWPLMMLVVGDLFGMQNFGSNYMFYDGLSLSVGTVTLAKYVTQYFYQSHIPTGTNTTVCYGQGCFQGTFWVVFVLLLSSILTSLLVLCSPLSREVYGTRKIQKY